MILEQIREDKINFFKMNEDLMRRLSMKRKSKVWVWTGSAVVLLGFGALIAASLYLFDMAIARDTDTFELYAGEEYNHVDEEVETMMELIEKGEAWLSQQEVEILEQVTDDGLTLYGRYIKNEQETDKLALLLHGYRGVSDQMGLAGALYAEQGFDLFIPDARAHGKSEGNFIGFGWPDRLDQINWLEKLIIEKGINQIVLHGESMGAATALMTAGEDKLPQQVKAVVADSPYTSVEDELSHQLENLFNVPSFPFIQLGSIITQIQAGYSFEEASALKQVKRNTPPLFLIHGDQDDLVPTYMSEELYAQATGETKLWIVSGADHVAAKFEKPEEYKERVLRFVHQYLD